MFKLPSVSVTKTRFDSQWRPLRKGLLFVSKITITIVNNNTAEKIKNIIYHFKVSLNILCSFPLVCLLGFLSAFLHTFHDSFKLSGEFSTFPVKNIVRFCWGKMERMRGGAEVWKVTSPEKSCTSACERLNDNSKWKSDNFNIMKNSKWLSRTVIFTEHTYVTVVDFKGYILSPNIPWGELDRCTPPLIFYQHFHQNPAMIRI